MTINEKANKTNLPVEKVAELALAADIDSVDMDRTLSQSEAVKLGVAVKSYVENKPSKAEPKTVRFWTKATNHMILVGTEHIKIKGNVLELDAEKDKSKIALIRRLRNIGGSYSIYEILNEPLDEDSDKFAEFNETLRGIAFTGGNGEGSKSGRKALRAMFSADELEDMGAAGFNLDRLVMKVLRNKTLKPVSNNI